MKYFKNTELAKLYNVSEKTVRNWAISAEEERLDLQLFEHKGRKYIANVSKNTVLIEQLVKRGKKFKNSRGSRVVSPTQKFYETYNQKQILDIISSLDIRHEIPIRYSYADGGAKYWDEYAKRLFNEEAPNILNKSIELLEITSGNIDHLSSDHKKINVVDLGPGNGLPVRPTLERLLKFGKLNRYIAIDYSKEILAILEQNIKEWFNGAVAFEGYIRDFSYERFDDLFVEDYTNETDNVPANLILLLGGTANNLRNPNHALQTINSSMGLEDILVYTSYLDTPSNRRYFDFNTSRSNQKLRCELIVGLLGIDDGLYDIEQRFDEQKRARSISFSPKVDLSINLELTSGARHVDLRKHEPILLWRHWHKDTVEIINQFDQNDFDIRQVVKSTDNQYLALVSKIKTSN